MKSIEGEQGKFSLLFFYMGSVSMFLVITVASCTSRETFAELYKLVAGFLSLSNTSFSMTLRDSPGLGHFLCYALLCFSLSGIFSHRSVIFAPLVAVGYGILMEIMQVFIPSRDSSFLDILINGIGVIVGLGLFFLVNRFCRRSGRGRYPLSRG